MTAAVVAATLPSTRASPSTARRLVEDTMRHWGYSARTIEPARLLTSELVTNALLHGRGTPALRIERHGAVVRVEVEDRGPGISATPGESDDSMPVHGRGLRIVDALADAWGSERIGPGVHVVWFELDESDRVVPTDAPRPDQTRGTSEPAVGLNRLATKERGMAPADNEAENRTSGRNWSGDQANGSQVTGVPVFRAEVREVDGTSATVDVTGEVDVATAPALRDVLHSLLSDDVTHLRLDLSDVAFIDSAGLGVLIGVLKRVRERNGTIELHQLQPAPRKVVEITGLDELFVLVD